MTYGGKARYSDQNVVEVESDLRGHGSATCKRKRLVSLPKLPELYYYANSAKRRDSKIPNARANARSTLIRVHCEREGRTRERAGGESDSSRQPGHMSQVTCLPNWENVLAKANNIRWGANEVIL